MRHTPLRPGQRAWQLTAAATAALLLLPAALYAWSWLGRDSRTDDVELRHHITAVRLDVPNGSVLLRPGPDDQVRLRTTRIWALTAPKVEQRWDGDTLTIRSTDPGYSLDGLAPRVMLELQVPASVVVDARLSSGSLDLAALQGDLDLRRRVTAAAKSAGISPGPNSVMPWYAAGSAQAETALPAASAASAGAAGHSAATDCGRLRAARSDEASTWPTWPSRSATVNLWQGVRWPSWSSRIAATVLAKAVAKACMAVCVAVCMAVLLSVSRVSRGASGQEVKGGAGSPVCPRRPR